MFEQQEIQGNKYDLAVLTVWIFTLCYYLCTLYSGGGSCILEDWFSWRTGAGVEGPGLQVQRGQEGQAQLEPRGDGDVNSTYNIYQINPFYSIILSTVT